MAQVLLNEVQKAQYAWEQGGFKSQFELATWMYANAIGCVMSDRPTPDSKATSITVGLYVRDVGYYVTITPCRLSADPWGIDAQCRIQTQAEYEKSRTSDSTAYKGINVGNRCGARNVLGRLLAPEIAKALADDAAKSIFPESR